MKRLEKIPPVPRMGHRETFSIGKTGKKMMNQKREEQRKKRKTHKLHLKLLVKKPCRKIK